MTLNSTMILTSTDPAYHGRVMSLYMLTFGVFPLMGGPLGVLADRYGGGEVFTVLGAGVLIFFALVVVLSPNLAGAGGGRGAACFL
jgi:MFS family permease